MKTSFRLRMIIVAATIIATACSEPQILPSENLGEEFHTGVTTWTKSTDNSYIGLVAQVPPVNLSAAKISINVNNKVVWVDILDSGKVPSLASMKTNFYWASLQNNIVLLHFSSSNPESLPQFPLDVVIYH